MKKQAQNEIKTNSGKTPYPRHRIIKDKTINATLLFQLCQKPNIQIDKTNKKTFTAINNPQIQEILQFLHQIQSWANQTLMHLVKLGVQRFPDKNHLFHIFKKKFRFQFFEKNLLNKFVEEFNGKDLKPIGIESKSKFLYLIKNLMMERENYWISSFFGNGNYESSSCLFYLQDFKRCLIPLHSLYCVALEGYNKLMSIENQIRDFIIEAVGCKVKLEDFRNCMNHWCTTNCDSLLQPKSFHYQIKRDSNAAMEGSLELLDDKNEEIVTFVQKLPSPSSPIQFPISGESTVRLKGEIFLHGCVEYEFKGKMRKKYNLNITPSTLGIFIVLVGNLIYENEFQPQWAQIVIKSSNEQIQVPIEINKIPSLKRFKKSIRSLSNHQQQFASSIREKTLSSSLLGICVIQVKPQLESILRLPFKLLTKEIQMTYELLRMFIEYQIPTDILSLSDSDDSQNAVELLHEKINQIYFMIYDYSNEFGSPEDERCGWKSISLFSKFKRINCEFGPFSCDSFVAIHKDTMESVCMIKFDKKEYRLDKSRLKHIYDSQKQENPYLQQYLGFFEDSEYFWIILEDFWKSFDDIVSISYFFF